MFFEIKDRDKNSYQVQIDDEDFEILSTRKWNAHQDTNTVYARRNTKINSKDKTFLMHRQILNISDPKIKVDHIDGNGLNNQRSNLRVCTNAENCRNRTINKNNKSGFKGVFWRKDISKWAAEIKVNGKNISLGFHADINDAANAYKKASRHHFKEFHREF